MSFLGNIISTIGGDKAPAPPVKPPSRPSSTKPQAPASSTPVAQAASSAKPVYKGTAGSQSTQQSTGTKRKADDAFVKDSLKTVKTDGQGAITDNQKLSKLTTDVANTAITKPSDRTSSPSTGLAPEKPAPKTLAKGSYAELMARAKEKQQTKGPSSIGMIKHQPVDKTRPSKLADRKKEVLEKGKDGRPTNSSRPGSSGKMDRRRSTSPAKLGDNNKGIKLSRPPSNVPPMAQYKGTMGLNSKKRGDHRAREKSNEYLGTDEEDEGDSDGYGGGDGYYSDASSVMEGGFDDLEAEEAAALRAAKEDDAREQAMEAKLKKEKMDRKQRLQAMAAKRK